MTEGNTNKIEVGPDMNKIIGEGTLEEMWGALVDKIVEERIEAIIEMTIMIETETGHFPEVIITIEIGVQATVGPGQDPEQVQTEIG